MAEEQEMPVCCKRMDPITTWLPVGKGRNGLKIIQPMQVLILRQKEWHSSRDPTTMEIGPKAGLHFMCMTIFMEMLTKIP